MIGSEEWGLWLIALTFTGSAILDNLLVTHLGLGCLTWGITLSYVSIVVRMKIVSRSWKKPYIIKC